MRRLIAIAMALVVLGCWSAAGALAARNPAGTGQPGTASPNGASCGSPGSTAMPSGFEGAGFEHATGVYAGSPGTPSAEHGSSHAISEYDIACYQQTQNHG
jgi:putative hemolysin